MSAPRSIRDRVASGSRMLAVLTDNSLYVVGTVSPWPSVISQHTIDWSERLIAMGTSRPRGWPAIGRVNPFPCRNFNGAVVLLAQSLFDAILNKITGK